MSKLVKLLGAALVVAFVLITALTPLGGNLSEKFEDVDAEVRAPPDASSPDPEPDMYPSPPPPPPPLYPTSPGPGPVPRPDYPATDGPGPADPPSPPQLDKYQLEVEAPREMDVEDTRTVRVSISLDGEQFEATEDLQVEAEIIDRRSSLLQVSARTSGGLTIDGSDEWSGEKKLYTGGRLEWSFNIVAVATGPHTVTVIVRQYVNDTLSTGDLSDVARVTINAGFWSRILDIVVTDLPKLIGDHLVAFLAGVTGLVLFWFRKRIARLLGLKDEDTAAGKGDEVDNPEPDNNGAGQY